MRTESDLRAALGELADAEPVTRVDDEADGDAVRPLVAPRAHRGGRWLAPVGASAAVIAVVAGTIALHQSEHNGVVQAGSPAPRPSHSLSIAPGTAQSPPPSTFTFDPTKPWLSCRAPADASYAGVVTHPDSAVSIVGILTCGNGVRIVEGGTTAIEYLPQGMFASDLLAGATPISAGSLSGWLLSNIVYPGCLTPQRDACELGDGVVWEYAPDAYAIGYPADLQNAHQLTQAIADDIAALAARVEPTAAAVVASPVTFAYRPDNVRTLEAATFQPSGTDPAHPDSGPGIDVQLGLDGAGTDCPAGTVCDPGVDVDLVYDLKNHPGEAVIVPVQGADDGVLRGTCGHFTFDASRYGVVTQAQLQEVVLGMRCATSADESTWTPITG